MFYQYMVFKILKYKKRGFLSSSSVLFSIIVEQGYKARKCGSVFIALFPMTFMLMTKSGSSVTAKNV